MPLNFMDCLDIDAFTALAGRLAERDDTDMFLSCQTSDSPVCRIGIAPRGEVALTQGTPKTEVAAFVFGTPGTTLGCVTYDYGMSLRGITSHKPEVCPAGRFRKYKALLVYNMATRRFAIEGDEAFAREVINAPLVRSEKAVCCQSGSVRESLDATRYPAGVEEVLERIRGGYTYQMCLSSEYSTTLTGLSPARLFMSLWQEYPAPYYALFRLDDTVVISSSPERFLRVSDGEVLSQPIKGTLAFETYSPDLVAEVTESPKESAELSMIVDLIRNDISTNCEYGSVRVEDHKSTFVVDNLIQMYSNVRGTLRADRTCLDLLLDAFPGGSVTGCPKLESMRIIEEVEPHRRGAYCGSMVVIDDERNMESSIIIRTALYEKSSGMFRFHAGSGIVIDSEPVAEYKETLAKAGKFLKIAGL